MRDTQRSKVYKWQEQFIDGNLLTLRECRDLLKQVGKHYKIPEPNVGDGRGRRGACWQFCSFTIKLPRWSRQNHIVLHEAAHWVKDILYGRDNAPHGKEFTGIYMYLMNKYMGVPAKLLSQTANNSRVDFVSASHCKPTQ